MWRHRTPAPEQTQALPGFLPAGGLTGKARHIRTQSGVEGPSRRGPQSQGNPLGSPFIPPKVFGTQSCTEPLKACFYDIPEHRERRRARVTKPRHTWSTLAASALLSEIHAFSLVTSRSVLVHVGSPVYLPLPSVWSSSPRQVCPSPLPLCWR